MTAPAETSQRHDPYAALRHRDFRIYLAGNLAVLLGLLMQTTTVGWFVHQRTNAAIDRLGFLGTIQNRLAPNLSADASAQIASLLNLGLVGLVQVIPVVALGLVAGHVADRYDRRRVILLCEAALLCGSLGLALIAYLDAPLRYAYMCLFLIGIGRAFQGPAKSAFFPQVVPREDFANAMTWSSGVFQAASVGGPALAGLILLLSGRVWVVFLVDAAAILLFAIALISIKPRPFIAEKKAASIEALAAGLRFVWESKVILGAISLDMFAVLLGGAVSLLPFFAKTILRVDDVHYGILVAAPSIGALLMSVYIAHRPPMQRAGRSLLLAVAAFGAATVVFGLSNSYWLSFLMLALTGAFDNISVVVRHTLVQLSTPEHMRGRVSAVNGMFISTSNELGGFESGAVAWLAALIAGSAIAGAKVSVVIGGLGTMLVVAAAAVLFPQIRRFGALHSAKPD